MRASVGVWWKGERKMVLERREVEVVEEYQEEPLCDGEGGDGEDKEVVVVGEGGKIWMQGKVLGAVLVAGESACVELQVKNHSPKKVHPLPLSPSSLSHLTNRRYVELGPNNNTLPTSPSPHSLLLLLHRRETTHTDLGTTPDVPV